MAFQSASTVLASPLRNKVFELGEGLLDRIEVRAVGRQETQFGAIDHHRRGQPITPQPDKWLFRQICSA
jgi:hypothetical protein